MARKRTTPVVKPTPKAVFRPYRRGGNITEAEERVVAQFLRDQPRELTSAQVTQLGKFLRRTPQTTRTIIERARDRFAEAAEDYVEAHITATQQALAEGEFDVAARASQWAMEHLASEGVRVVEKAEAVSTQPKVMIGINLGGIGRVEPVAIPADATVTESHDG
jgi:hypothetical protein